MLELSHYCHNTIYGLPKLVRRVPIQMHWLLICLQPLLVIGKLQLDSSNKLLVYSIFFTAKQFLLYKKEQSKVQQKKQQQPEQRTKEIIIQPGRAPALLGVCAPFVQTVFHFCNELKISPNFCNISKPPCLPLYDYLHRRSAGAW